MFHTCTKCGLQQSGATVARAEGKCMRCGGEVTEGKVEEAKRQTVSPETKAKLAESPVLPGEPDPWQLSPESQTVSQKPVATNPLGGEIPFSQLAQQLETATGKPVTIQEVAKMEPEKRKELAGATRVSANPIQHNPTYTPGGDKVTAVWAEEQFSPGGGSFSTCKIGPFFAETTLHQGETVEQALSRLLLGLGIQAERERTRKTESFLRAYKGFKEASVAT